MRAMLLPGRLQATSDALACGERQAAHWLDQRECRVRRGTNDTTLPPETRPAHPPLSSVGDGQWWPTPLPLGSDVKRPEMHGSVQLTLELFSPCATYPSSLLNMGFNLTCTKVRFSHMSTATSGCYHAVVTEPFHRQYTLCSKKCAMKRQEYPTIDEQNKLFICTRFLPLAPARVEG